MGSSPEVDGPKEQNPILQDRLEKASVAYIEQVKGSPFATVIGPINKARGLNALRLTTNMSQFRDWYAVGVENQGYLPEDKNEVLSGVREELESEYEMIWGLFKSRKGKKEIITPQEIEEYLKEHGQYHITLKELDQFEGELLAETQQEMDALYKKVLGETS